MDWIDEEINTGKYGKSEGVGYYPKCNIFTSGIAERGWGVKLPRLRDDQYVRRNDYDNKYPGNEDKPMSAVTLRDYYRERSMLEGSGVKEVPPQVASQLANNEKLVLVVGQGHATIAAPSDKNWPTVYRSDAPTRGTDKRTRVGVNLDKKGKSAFQFFVINPEEYNNFSKTLKDSGYSDEDIYARYREAKEDEKKSPKAFTSSLSGKTLINNEKFRKLQEMLRKK